MRILALWSWSWIVASVFVGSRSAGAADTSPFLTGYADDAVYNEQIEKLKESDLVKVREVGQSVGGRKLWLVTVGKGDVDSKPAIAVVGGTDGKLLFGSELTLRMIQQLVQKSADDLAVAEVLDRHTFYFLPRPDPDTAQKCFAKPMSIPQGNDRTTDDDRDFETGEDPADDLNGDGLITQMRIEDSTGKYLVHPNDDRLMVEADQKKKERGKYVVLLEGRDDDKDEQFNEDGSGGVAIDHNFPHQYRSFQPHTGEHAASEPETRALIDFFLDHPNIAIVFSFSAEDNLFHPLKPSTDKERIRKSIFPADSSLLELIANDYKNVHGGSDSPSPPGANGSFAQWAYFQYGRPSLTARAWWPPKTNAKTSAEEGKKDESSEGDASTPEKPDDKTAQANPGEKKPAEDKRSAEDRNLLSWLEKEQLDGFVPWQVVEHPDFPGKKVEVGGFKPLAGLNPPVAELDGLAEKHLKFVLKLPEYLPEVAVVDVKAEPLAGGLFRLSAKVVNRGYLPTMLEMGRVNGQPYPLQVGFELPEGAELVQGNARERLTRLDSGDHTEKTWLLRFKNETPEKLMLKAWAPHVGTSEVEVPLK